ncbi:MAG: hypothetical protein Q7T18_06020 [Sedimentisphaerales bacterium]|nr:hypothetical protein [Sedimentisphaerales bacterium]
MKKAGVLSYIKTGIMLVVIGAIAVVGWYFFQKYRENETLRQVIERLTADTRTAEMIVSDVNNGRTTIKFVEYDADLRPLAPHYFTFKNNIIQFQSLLIRFEDDYVKYGDKLRGKSVYVFWKVFALGDSNTAEIFEINKLGEVPAGYEIKNHGRNAHATNEFEQKLWRDFWDYALEQEKAKSMGIKNAQVEAPGTKFMPGKLYTIKIEHDGGLRIDVQPLPEILKGEKVPK